MSRSNNTEIPNPASVFYRWDGDKGGFNYWDKASEKRIEVALPFTFMVLDTLSTIKGYNDFEKCGFWSNEIRDITKDTLTVRTKSGIAAKGTYHEIMESRACDGAKYCQSVYIADTNNEEIKIANVQMTGASLSAWIEFRKKINVFKGQISVDSMLEGKKGKVEFKIPVFKIGQATEEQEAKANDLDVELQNYLGLYLAKNQVHVDAPAEVKVEAEAQLEPPVEVKDDLPF